MYEDRVEFKIGSEVILLEATQEIHSFNHAESSREIFISRQDDNLLKTSRGLKATRDS